MTDPRRGAGRSGFDVVDIFLAVPLVYLTIRGYLKGLVNTVAYFVSPIAGIAAGLRYADEAAVLATAYADIPERLLRPVEAIDLPGLGGGGAPSVLTVFMVPAVFVVAAVAVRLAGGALTRMLGLEDSLLSRTGGAALGATAAALVLGTSILVLRGVVPMSVEPPPGSPPAVEAAQEQARGWLRSMDDSVRASILGPPLAAFAEAVLASYGDGDRDDLRDRVLR